MLLRNIRQEDFERIKTALEGLDKDPVAAGKVYALESRRCFRCDRELTDPESIGNGIGPDCLTHLGLGMVG